LAHQYTDQITQGNDTRVKDAIFGNVGSLACFRIGAKDLELMSKPFAPVFTDFDLLNVPAWNCYIKLMVENQNPSPFNMKIRPPLYFDKSQRNEKMSQAIRQLSRYKYGRDRRVVEDEVEERIRRIDILASSL